MAPKESKNKNNQEKYIRNKKEGRSFPCDLCELYFNSRSTYQRHKRKEHQSTAIQTSFFCRTCQLYFSSKSCLTRHFVKKHNNKVSSGSTTDDAPNKFNLTSPYAIQVLLPVTVEDETSAHDNVTEPDQPTSRTSSSADGRANLIVTATDTTNSLPTKTAEFSARKYDVTDSITVQNVQEVFDCFVCGECGIYFNSRATFYRHKSKMHEPQIRITPFYCPECDLFFSTRSCLVRHRTKKHNPPADIIPPVNPPADIVVPEHGYAALDCVSVSVGASLCSTDDHTTTPELHEYDAEQSTIQDNQANEEDLVSSNRPDSPANENTESPIAPESPETMKTTVRVVKMKKDCTKFTFPNMEDFLNWKFQLERETITRFVKRRGPLKRGLVRQVQYFHCHRSGYFRPRRTPAIKAMKTNGSHKVGCVCKAYISAETYLENNQTVRVTYMSNHTGHDVKDVNEIRRLPLSSQEKGFLANQIAEGVSFDSILKTIKDQFSFTDRFSYTTRKDLHNIAKEYNIVRGVEESNEVEETPSNENENEIATEIIEHDSGVTTQSHDKSFDEEKTELVSALQGLIEEINKCTNREQLEAITGEFPDLFEKRNPL